MRARVAGQACAVVAAEVAVADAVLAARRGEAVVDARLAAHARVAEGALALVAAVGEQVGARAVVEAGRARAEVDLHLTLGALVGLLTQAAVEAVVQVVARAAVDARRAHARLDADGAVGARVARQACACE